MKIVIQRSKILLAFFSFLLCGNLSGKDSYLTLNIANNSQQNVVATRTLINSAEMSVSYRIALDAEGKADFALPMYEKFGFYMLEIAEVQIIIYLEEDKRLDVSLDAKNPKNTIKFGSDLAANNSFFGRFMNNYSSSMITEWRQGLVYFQAPSSLEQAGDTRTASQHAIAVKDRLVNQITELNAAKTTISPELYDYLILKSRSEADVARIAWLAQNLKRLTSGTYSITANALGITAPVDVPSKFQHPSYANYIRAWVCYKVWSDYFSQTEKPSLWYQTAAQHLSGRPGMAIQSEIICNTFYKFGDKDFAPSVFAEFQKNCPYPEYIQPIIDTYGDDLRFVQNAAAPELLFTDVNGVRHNISDYKGKVIYLSFWASWCKPCLAGFQKSATLRQDLEAMGIVLLNISIDQNREAYNSALERNNIVGVVGLADNISDTQKSYGLSTLPAYYIINKEGNFTYLPPSDNRNIVEEFRKLVNQ